MKNKLYVILGKSASGKSAITKSLLERIAKEELPIKVLPSYTTRPIRENETDGVDYNFMTLKDFDTSYKNNEVIEYNTYRIDKIRATWVYYSLRKDVDLKNGSMLKIINPSGLSQLRQQFKDDIVVFYIDCPDEIRRERYLQRREVPDSLTDRFKRDDDDFRYVKYDYLIENDGTKSIENRVNLILSLMKGEMCIE